MIIQISFWHCFTSEINLPHFSPCKEKACVSYSKVEILFVAASGNDQAPQSVEYGAIGHLSLNRPLTKNSSLPLPHDAYMLTSTYVYICVFVNIHIFRNMCMGANIYNTA